MVFFNKTKDTEVRNYNYSATIETLFSNRVLINKNSIELIYQ